MATTSPAPLVTPFAERLGIDAVIATRWATDERHVHRRARRTDSSGVAASCEAVQAWAADERIDLRGSWAYSDSYYDAPLLAARRHGGGGQPGRAPRRAGPAARLADPPPRPARGRAQDRRPGAAGVDPSLQRPELLTQRPPRRRRRGEDPAGRPGDRGVQPPQLLRRHRRRRGARPDRSLVPVPRQEGGLRRPGHRRVLADGRRDPGQPLVGLRRAAGAGDQGAAGRRGDRARAGGHDPARSGVLRHRAARSLGRGPPCRRPPARPVIPVGLWGTEKVWPRNSPAAHAHASPSRPEIRVRVGDPVPLQHRSLDADTKRIMTALDRPAAPTRRASAAHADRRGAGRHLPARLPRRPDARGRPPAGHRHVTARLHDRHGAAPWHEPRPGLSRTHRPVRSSASSAG